VNAPALLDATFYDLLTLIEAIIRRDWLSNMYYCNDYKKYTQLYPQGHS